MHLTGSVLSLDGLFASFKSIWSSSSLNKYLSKSEPNCSDNYTNGDKRMRVFCLLTCCRSVDACGMPFLETRELMMNLISQRQALALEN